MHLYNLLVFYALLACLAWCIVYVRIIRSIFSIPFFDRMMPPEPEAWPKLSVVIPACNEEKTIEKALKTVLDQNYPDLEVIVINDRSTDETGRIINALASRYWSLRAIHVDSLPEGWLGKVHAQHIGTQKARGEWILYTDADVHFSQGALKKGVALAISEGAGYLAVAPGLVIGSFLLEIVVNAFGGMFLFFTDAGRINRGKSKKAVGVGAFNLVRRSALEKTEGLEWLKMEVADDVGLAILLKNSGARGRFAIAKEDISLSWYSSVGDMFKGLEKNIFGATCRYSYFRMVVLFIITIAYALGPLFAVTAFLDYRIRLAGVLAYVLLMASALIRKIKFGSRFLPDLFLPLGQIIIAYMLLWAGTLCRAQKGIVWRGTLYPLSELRKGQRVKL